MKKGYNASIRKALSRGRKHDSMLRWMEQIGVPRQERKDLVRQAYSPKGLLNLMPLRLRRTLDKFKVKKQGVFYDYIQGDKEPCTPEATTSILYSVGLEKRTAAA